MQVKIDTREKFHVITINESTLAANMTAELNECVVRVQQNGVKNVVLNLQDIKNIDMDHQKLLQLCPRQYYDVNDLENKTKTFGFIAEEVFQVMPELTILNDVNEPVNVRYNDFHNLLFSQLSHRNHAHSNSMLK